MFVRSRRGACHTMERNLGQETAWRDPTDGTTLLCHKDLKSTQLNKDPTDGTTLHCYATKILTRSHRWNHTTQLNKDPNAITDGTTLLCHTTQQRSLLCHKDLKSTQLNKDLSTIPEIEINQRPQCPTIPHHSS